MAFKSTGNAFKTVVDCDISSKKQKTMDSKTCPVTTKASNKVLKLTRNLLATYGDINKRYYAAKEKHVAEKAVWRRERELKQLEMESLKEFKRLKDLERLKEEEFNKLERLKGLEQSKQLQPFEIKHLQELKRSKELDRAIKMFEYKLGDCIGIRNRYQIVTKLGQGTYGIVLNCLDNATQV
jgi:tRNA/tmRNA/rRNA uracil-C5-methylase (TrmA/RlmC/RlmD family)